MYDFDSSVPFGKGRIYKFSEGIKKWATIGGDMIICPYAVTALEQKELSKDKDKILEAINNLKVSDCVKDNIIFGCDGWKDFDSNIIYDKDGNRL